ncbi:MAG: Coenzyme F420 hydrogenase/dehydrogenase, beta subunit C-terminal domain, partial [Candidatus Methanomethyliaceae archaeon]
TMDKISKRLIDILLFQFRSGLSCQSSSRNYLKELLYQEFCVDCGACAGICPVQAITLKSWDFDWKGINIDTQKCINCGLCKKLCPGLAHRVLVPNGFAEGPILAAYLAVANDPQIRHCAASGGVTSALTIAWLRQNPKQHKALTLLPNQIGEPPLFPLGVFINKPEHVKEAAGSHYIGGPLLQNLNKLLPDEVHQCLVVGLPCQIRAAKQYAKLTSSTWGPKIGLFCSGRRHPMFLKWLLRYLHCSFNDISKFYSRRNGSPGNILIQKVDETFIVLPRTDPIINFSTRNATFLLRNCLWCPDPFSSLADISCGDPWDLSDIPEQGATLVILRNKTGIDLFEKTFNMGLIKIIRSLTLNEVMHNNKGLRNKASLVPFIAKQMGICSYKINLNKVNFLLFLRALKYLLRWKISSSFLGSCIPYLPKKIISFIAKI